MDIINTLLLATIFVSILGLFVWMRKWFGLMLRNQYKTHARLAEMELKNNKLDNKLLSAISNSTSENLNALSIQSLGFNFPVFLGGWSIDSFLGRYLIQNIIERRPKCIVELGSGSSTIIISRILQLLNDNTTTHIAIDHESKYLNITKSIAELNGVADRIHFVHCSLEKNNQTNMIWYGGLDDVLKDKSIDLLIIDGPPGNIQPYSRYPAIPELRNSLSSNITIILDDANRADEQEIAKRWAKDLPNTTLEFITEGHGLAILQR